MSFYSSLVVLHPGRPPLLTVSELREFCERLREALSLAEGSPAVQLTYGEPDLEAFEATHQLSWDASQTVATLPVEDEVGPPEPDHYQSDKPWPKLWPGRGSQRKTVHDATCSLGVLTHDMYEELRAEVPEHRYERIGVDRLSVNLGRIYAHGMGEWPDDADLCYGFFGVRLSGYGYFTWQPLETYWQKASRSAFLRKLLGICRESYPVPPLSDRAALEKALGRLFLNREEYQHGDWIVSISESG